MMIKEKLTADTYSMFKAVDDKGFALELYLKLREYENTGLTPAEVLRMQRELKRLQTLIDCFIGQEARL